MRLTLCLLALSVYVFPVAAQAPKTYTYQILYTGRTLGYARVPDEQTLPLTKPTRNNASQIAKEFLDQLALATAKPPKDDPQKIMPQLRIAMGDNFSPDLYGRSIKIDKNVKSCGSKGTYSSEIHLPKDYFDFARNQWYIWCDDSPIVTNSFFADNVADFLIMGHYDAVVPGKHDFYFGPQYLRQIANYLKDNGVRMLGENLIINATVAPGAMNTHPRIPERLSDPCHWNTSHDHDCYHTDFGPASLDLPDNVLPWKRQFVLHGARAARDAKTGKLLSKDLLKNFKDSDVTYISVFQSDSVNICVEPGPRTSGDPSDALKHGTKCFALVASYSENACGGFKIPDHLKSPCKALYNKTGGAYDRTKQTASTDIAYLFKDPRAYLEAGLNHAFCVDPTDDFPIFGESRREFRICQPFPVQMPMFWADPDNPAPEKSISEKASTSQVASVNAPAQEKAAPRGMAKCADAAEIPCPYYLVPRGQLSIAIFGVVDPDLLSNVGMLNASWLNKNPKWDTSAQVTAPDYALLQTLELCYTDDNCREAPKVLMAQMSYARATQLIANSNFNGVFDVVITQASADHDTGIIHNQYQGTTPRFTLTPPESLSTDSMSAPVFTPQVYVATIEKKSAPTAPERYDDDAMYERQTCHANPKTPSPIPASPSDAHDFGPCWSIRNTTARYDISIATNRDVYPPSDLKKLPAQSPPTCTPGATCYTLEQLAKEYLAKYNSDRSAQAYPLTNPSASDPVAQAVLFAMRKSLGADAAILQTRDLYDSDNQSRQRFEIKNLQDQISRVIWKGDMAIVLHITGATIRKLLKQSATFAKLDKNSLNTEIEAGRDLITRLYADPKDSDTIYINGAVMNDATIYAVAATDFISGGDTGYADLTSPDVLPAYRVRDFAHPRIKPITGMVCTEIAAPVAAGTNICADMLSVPTTLTTLIEFL